MTGFLYNSKTEPHPSRHWEEKEICRLHGPKLYVEAAQISACEVSASETKNQRGQLPGTAVGKRKQKAREVVGRALPIFLFIFGVRKREVDIFGLQYLHRENLGHLQVEEPT